MIDVNRDPARDITMFTASGVVGADEVMQEMSRFYDSDPTHLVLWDFRAADVSGITSDEVRMIAGLAGGAYRNRAEGKTAIVASKEVTYGLSRMYQSLLDGAELSVDTRIFRSIEEAEAFLFG